MEYNDIYDKDFGLTGRVHLRGTPWGPGEYGLVVCVYVYDGQGRFLLTRRAPEKSFAGTWENSGGAAQAGEDARTAIARELFEETGIRAAPEEFEYFDSDRDEFFHYRFFCLKRAVALADIVLLPGETDDVRWVTFDQARDMIARGQICRTIARQFLRHERFLEKRQNAQK